MVKIIMKSNKNVVSYEVEASTSKEDKKETKEAAEKKGGKK